MNTRCWNHAPTCHLILRAISACLLCLYARPPCAEGGGAYRLYQDLHRPRLNRQDQVRFILVGPLVTLVPELLPLLQGDGLVPPRLS